METNYKVDRKQIFEDEYVKALFNKMSKTYDRMNHITSFGFSSRWRNQFIKNIGLKEGDIVADLMTGMGECWKPIQKEIGSSGHILAVDFSEGMLDHAKLRQLKQGYTNTTILQENVFASSIADGSVNAVVSGFGIKTFDNQQIEDLAVTIHKMLRPNGIISFVEISVPGNAFLKAFYIFYLKWIIPILGSIFLGKPDTYAMLGVYTTKFVNARKVYEIFSANGFEVNYKAYFFGCATGITGRKTITNK